MQGLNRVELIGNLGQDPQLRYTQNGSAVVTLSVATSESWTSKDGEKKERTDWHRVVIWGKLAEVAAEHLAKGSPVYLCGKLQTRSYDKNGEKRYQTEVVLQTGPGGDRMIMLGNGNGHSSGGGINDSDIPF